MKIFSGEDIINNEVMKLIKKELRLLDIREVSEYAIHDHLIDYFQNDNYANSHKVYHKIRDLINRELNNALTFEGRKSEEQRIEEAKIKLKEIDDFIELWIEDEIVRRISKWDLFYAVKNLSEEIKLSQNRNWNPDWTSSYSDYLLSDYWKDLSKEVKERDWNRCVLCNRSDNLQAHHRSYKYKNTREKEILDVHTLCKDCHLLFHKHSKLYSS